MTKIVDRKVDKRLLKNINTSSFIASAHPKEILEIAKPRGSWEQDEIMRMRIGWFLIAILTSTVIGLRLFAQKS